MRCTTDPTCHYPAGRCPLHDEPTPPAESPAEAPADHDDYLRETLNEVATAIRNGTADTAQATRLLMALQSILNVAHPPASEKALDEAFLRGKIVNALPPETIEEWELAREMYNDDDLKELAMWPMCYPWGTVPDWANALRDPNDTRYAWRFRHPDGAWNDRHAKKLHARTYALRGLTDNPYEHALPSNSDADCIKFDCYNCGIRPDRPFPELVDRWKQYYVKHLEKWPKPPG